MDEDKLLEPQDGVGEGGETPEPESPKTPEVIDPDKFQAVLKDRSAKNRELIAAKKRLAELEAAEEERKRASMSELEKLKADLDKERQARLDRELALAAKDRAIAVADAGVQPVYRDVVAGMLDRARGGEGHDDKEWFENLKQTQPALFGAATPAAAGGGPARPGSGPSDVAALQKRLEEMRKPGAKRNLLEESMLLQALAKAKR